MHRLFAAIRPPEPVRDLLIDAMDDSPSLRWVGDEQLHLTLRFIGEVGRPQANDIAAELARIRFPRFQLRLSGIGRFERRSGGALWAGVEPRRPVVDLAAKIERACVNAGLEPEHRAFHPHITIARWNRRGTEAAAQFECSHSQLSSPAFDVTQFTLFESHLSRHGAHYEEAAVFRLA